MTTQDAENKSRRFARLPKEATIGVSELTYPLSPQSKDLGRSKDISPVGICFRSATMFAPNTTLTLSIHLPGWHIHKKNLSFKLDDSSVGKPLTVLAKVVWSKPSDDGNEYECGVVFIDIHDDDYQSLQKFLGI
ncbi:MAG: PilZ domain-containing protein [Thermodesulfobacteriota bacterium]